MWTVRTPASHFAFYIKLIEINGRDFSLPFFQPKTKHLSSQEAPSACLDPLTYTVKHVPYQEQGAQMGVLCENSICEISSSAYTISLMVLQNETTFLEESVYFPAVKDNSELSYFQFASLMGLFIDLLIPVCI